jgi:hypothetical protein
LSTKIGHPVYRLKSISVAFACEVEFDIMVELEVEFQHQINNERLVDMVDYS